MLPWLAVLSAFLSPWRRELFVGDETKYAQVIREMRATGSFLLPTLDGTPFTHKPPLHFWIVDLLTVPFGLYSLWPFVLPSLAGLVALILILRQLSRHLLPDADPNLAMFVCATSALVWGSSQSARMDIPFTALIAAGALLLYRFFESGDFRTLLLAAVSLGVAALVKGPMAPVIGLVLFAFERWRRGSAPRGNYFPAIAALAVIPLLWFVPAMMLGGNAYASEVLGKQIAGRAVGAWVHRSPPWFYLLRSPLTLFPWGFLFLAALVAFFRRGREGEGAAHCVSWIAAVVIPYSLMSSKLDVYMMALIPPVSLLAGDFVSRGTGDRFATAGRYANNALIALLGATGLAVFALLPRLGLREEQAAARAPEVRFLFLILAVAAAIALFAGWRSLQGSTIALGTVVLALWFYAGLFILPLANREASTLRMIEAIRREGVAPESVALYASPYLWVRDMPRDLERVRHIDAASPAADASVIITSRKHAQQIAPLLRSFRKRGEFLMIGKWFDVYRR